MNENTSSTTETVEPAANTAFQKLDNESPRAFEAFICYYEMGGKRTVAKVAAELGAPEATVATWCTTFSWRQRISNYFSSLVTNRLKAREAAARAEVLAKAERRRLAEENSSQVAGLLQGTADDLLQHFLRSNPTVKLDEITKLYLASAKFSELAFHHTTAKNIAEIKNRPPNPDLERLFGPDDPPIPQLPEPAPDAPETAPNSAKPLPAE